MVNPKLRCVTAVYKLYDTFGDLIYVGITIDPETRFKKHSYDKWWWPTVHRTEIEWTLSFRIAEHVESQLIETHQPKHNVRGSEKQAYWNSHPVNVAKRAERAELLAKYQANSATRAYAYMYVSEELRRRLKEKQAAVAEYVASLVVVPFRQLMRQLRRQLDSVMEDGKTLIVTRNGKAVGCIIPQEDYELLLADWRKKGLPMPVTNTLEVG